MKKIGIIVILLVAFFSGILMATIPMPKKYPIQEDWKDILGIFVRYITSKNNRDIIIEPNGTGQVKFVGDVNFAQTNGLLARKTLDVERAFHVNVKDFGAHSTTESGYETFDSTEAIQAAVNSMPIGGAGGGRVLFFPPGIYIISNKIVVGWRRLTIMGSGVTGSGGTTIKQINADSDFIDYTTGNGDTLSVFNICFEGTGSDGTSSAIVLGSEGQGCFDSRIQNCWFFKIPDTCIKALNISGYHITLCGFDSSSSIGIYIAKGGCDVIENNRFYGQSEGIHIDYGLTETIVGNYFDICGQATVDANQAAIVIDRSGTESRGNTIIANTFRNNWYDIVLNGRGGNFQSHTGVNSTSILANHSDRPGIRFLVATDAHETRIVGNTIDTPGEHFLTYLAYDSKAAPIEILGTSKNTIIYENSTSFAHINLRVLPYALRLGINTTETKLGINHFSSYTKTPVLVEGTLSPSIIENSLQITGDLSIYNTTSLGEDLVTNGNFATSDSWIWGTGWEHDAVNFEADHSAGNTAKLEQALIINAKTNYLLTFTIRNNTYTDDALILVTLGGTNSDFWVHGNDTFTKIIRTTNDSGNLQFMPIAGFNGSIDDVIVKEIKGGDIDIAGNYRIAGARAIDPNLYEFWENSKVAVTGGALYNKIQTLPIRWQDAHTIVEANEPSGNTSKALKVYDETGNLLGYIPVYANKW